MKFKVISLTSLGMQIESTVTTADISCIWPIALFYINCPGIVPWNNKLFQTMLQQLLFGFIVLEVSASVVKRSNGGCNASKMCHYGGICDWRGQCACQFDCQQKLWPGKIYCGPKEVIWFFCAGATTAACRFSEVLLLLTFLNQWTNSSKRKSNIFAKGLVRFVVIE